MQPGRIALVQLPTPLHRLNRASEDLGIDLWIKRDDLTGFAFGGNKGRKLEYLMYEVVTANADVVVTCGSAQSNFIRQLGAACACLGVACTAVVMNLPFDKVPLSLGKGEGIGIRREGNALLDDLLGVDLRPMPDGPWDELYSATEEVARQLEAEGKRVHRIPIGGSSPFGAYGFLKAAEELTDQVSAINRDFGPQLSPLGWEKEISGEGCASIVFASSSGSTHVGLAMGLQGSATRLLGIACDPEPEIAEDFADLANSLEQLLEGEKTWLAQDFHLDFRFVGPGYGVPSNEGNEAIRYLARREGIFLDPIYSGKAFAGLIQLAREGAIEGRVLFWHTGGLPALFVPPAA